MVTIKIKPKYPKHILRHPLIHGFFAGFITTSGIFSALTINIIWGMFLFAWGIILLMAAFMGDKEE